MSPGFDLSSYEPVEERLARFWADWPQGRVLTEIVEHTEKQWVLKASVYRYKDDEGPAATGYAQEIIGQGNVNRTSALENGETSAVGRALAQMGYAPKGKRPSREEMAKVEAGSTPMPNREQGTTDGAPAASKPVSPPTTISDDAAETTLIPKAMTPEVLLEKYGWEKVKPVARLVGMDRHGPVPITQEQFMKLSGDLILETATRLGFNQKTLQGAP